MYFSRLVIIPDYYYILFVMCCDRETKYSCLCDWGEIDGVKWDSLLPSGSGVLFVEPWRRIGHFAYSGRVFPSHLLRSLRHWRYRHVSSAKVVFLTNRISSRRIAETA